MIPVKDKINPIIIKNADMLPTLLFFLILSYFNHWLEVSFYKILSIIQYPITTISEL